MADPILPGVIRTMVVMQNANELPTDRYITTWAFKAAGAVNLPVHGAAILTAMTAFFNSVAAGAAVAVGAFIGPQASRVALSTRVVSYDLGTAPPRSPFDTGFTLIAPQSSAPIPAEVACCLSLKSAHNGPRGRGRVYIGPFNQSAVGTPEAGDARPEGSMTTAVRMAALALTGSAVLVDAGLQWVIVSHSDATTYAVNGGYVDNAWDTHRSRGLEASGRAIF
jgi:hypothetical protein